MSGTISFSGQPYQSYFSPLSQKIISLDTAPVHSRNPVAKASRRKEDFTHFSGSPTDVSKAFEEINIPLHLDNMLKMSANSKEFKEVAFDIAFNAARRLCPTVGEKRLDIWREKYDENYKHLEKAMEALYKLPEDQQKQILFAMNVLTVMAPVSFSHYRQNLEKLIDGSLKPKEILQEAQSDLEKLKNNKQDLQQKRLLSEASRLQKLGLITTSDYILYLSGKANPQERYRFEKRIDKLTRMVKSPPKSPRVLLFFNAREGGIGRAGDLNTSHENALLTDKLRDYWRQKGCEIVYVDGSGGATNQPLSMTALFKAVQPSGFITGGGPDINPEDPFVKNLKSLIEHADSKDLPYFAECLGHQLIGMIKSGEKDYKKYVGQLKDRKSYSPDDISVLDTKEMEHDHALYGSDLGKMLERREAKRALGQKINPIRVYSIHNNIVNDKKQLEPRVFIAARSLDNEKAPEILAKQDKHGKRQIISTQFHPSELTADSRYLQRMSPFDEEFGLAILNTSINKMKEFHQKKLAPLDEKHKE